MRYFVFSRPRGFDGPYSTIELVAFQAAEVMKFLAKYRARAGHIGAAKDYHIMRNR